MRKTKKIEQKLTQSRLNWLFCIYSNLSCAVLSLSVLLSVAVLNFILFYCQIRLHSRLFIHCRLKANLIVVHDTGTFLSIGVSLFFASLWLLLFFRFSFCLLLSIILFRFLSFSVSLPPSSSHKTTVTI